MKIILAVEGEVKGNQYYIALKEAFPNLVATNTPRGTIDWVYRTFSENVLLVLDEDFFLQALKSNPFFEKTLRGLARDNHVELHIILFHQKGKRFKGFQYGADYFVRETKPSELPQRTRGIIRRNGLK